MTAACPLTSVSPRIRGGDTTAQFAPSEIGPLPLGWNTAKLGDILDFQNGVNADAKAYGSGIPFANVLEVLTHSHLKAADIPDSVKLTKAQVRSYRVRRGDVLFNRTSETQEEVGLASVYADDADIVFGGFVIRGRLKTDDFDPCYCGYAWRHPLVRRQIIARGQGAIRANIGQSDLRTVIVPKPPLLEQHRIAEVISDADEFAQALEALMAKRRAIKQDAMRQLMSGQRRLVGFRGQWKAGHFGELVRIRNEKIFTLGSPAAEWCVELEQMEQGTGVVSAFSDARERAATKYSFSAGDVLFGRLRPYLQKYWCADRAGVCSTEIWPLTPSTRELNPRFLGHLVRTDAFIGAACAAYGTHMPRADWKALSAYTFPLPPTDEEQAAIAAVLTDMDDEMVYLSRKARKAQQLKQGMSQELLTGRVRLI